MFDFIYYSRCTIVNIVFWHIRLIYLLIYLLKLLVRPISTWPENVLVCSAEASSLWVHYKRNMNVSLKHGVRTINQTMKTTLITCVDTRQYAPVAVTNLGHGTSFTCLDPLIIWPLTFVPCLELSSNVTWSVNPCGNSTTIHCGVVTAATWAPWWRAPHPVTCKHLSLPWFTV